VLATGRGERLRRSLGIQRRLLRERHSLCIGFSLTSDGPESAPIESFILHGERAGDGIGFVSLFPMDGVTRVNLFCYRDPKAAWALGFREDPLGSLTRTFPRLAPLLKGAKVAGPAEFGVTDLYEAQDHLQAGVVVIGDAFRSSCPATGMGITRILTDVRQLSRIYVPSWLATEGMPARKIAEFYDDPAKRAVDLHSRRSAETGRAAATLVSLGWRAYRILRNFKRALGDAQIRLSRLGPTVGADA
jgi:2-polyprenyl-6-methoxyphenol hydroxylase-like FAD-dependent oxidoreductase